MAVAAAHAAYTPSLEMRRSAHPATVNEASFTDGGSAENAGAVFRRSRGIHSIPGDKKTRREAGFFVRQLNTQKFM